jgi:hypothetical protein
MMHANLAIPAHSSIDFLSLGAVWLGRAPGALVTEVSGDTTMPLLEQVRSLARGGSTRIQR